MMMKQPLLLTTVVVVALSAATVVSAFAPSSSSLNKRGISTALQSSNPQDQRQQRQQPSSSDEEFTIEGYSRCLSPWEAKQSVKNESRQYSIIDRRPKWQKPLKLVTKPLQKVLSITSTKPKKPGSLILLRCGESTWTKTGRFTGWGEFIIIL
jgi:hypothetical protein